MTAFRPSLLQTWLENRLQRQGCTLEQLEAFQLAQLNQTLSHARENSPFYRQRLNHGARGPLPALSQVSDLPFTTADDIRRHHLNMLCVSHGEVARVVTLQTSGTTFSPKRLYFSEQDLETTIDFFHYGMACFVRPGERVLILLPGQKPDSVGDLLKRGIGRIPGTAHIHWPITDLKLVLEEMNALKIDCLAGAPAQIFALCRLEAGRFLKHGLNSVLLTTDYVPGAVVEDLKKVWNCDVYEHYGMTEMGLGGALQCDAHDGYHLREADLLFEIIDPENARPVPPGKEGEVVFTTLTRRAMPLIRYRTGDRACWLTGACACGSAMRRMGKVSGRLAETAFGDRALSMPLLDEALLPLPGLLSFRVAGKDDGKDIFLDFTLFCREQTASFLKEAVPKTAGQLFSKRLNVSPNISVRTLPVGALQWDATGMVKRTIGLMA